MSRGLVEHETAGEQRAVGRHRLTPAVLTVLGLLAAVESWRLGLGNLIEPGPGAWPLVASIGVSMTGTWLTITGVDRPEKVAITDLGRVAVAVASVALFIVLLPLVGMPVPALVLIAVWLRLFGESWRLTFVTATLGVVALQVVFVEMLGVPLPIGPLAPGR